MGLGDMLGKAAGLLGDNFDIGAKMEEMGIDPSMLEGLDVEGVKSLIEEKGLDLSMLENLGLDLDELLEKFLGNKDA